MTGPLDVRALWAACAYGSAPLHYGGAPYDDAAYGGAVLWRHCTMAAAYYGGVIMVAPQYDGTVMMALHCGGAAL